MEKGDPNAHRRRPDMVVCRECYWFQDKHHGVHVRHAQRGRPPNDWRRQCVWFHSEAGRRATPDERMTVMVAGANGGRNCPRTERLT